MSAPGRPFRPGEARTVEAGRKGGARTAASRRKVRRSYTGTILDAMQDGGFSDPTWAPWRTLWRAAFGLGLTPQDRQRFEVHTKRQTCPSAQVREGWVIAGRRSGKSRQAALLALYLGIRFDARRLAPGELAVVPLVAANRDQARIVMSYLRGLCARDEFRPYVHRVLKESVELHTAINVEVLAASYRTLRGYTVAGCVLDEIAFWSSEDSLNPDHEIVDALRPGMATVAGSLLFAISSPYGRRGELFEVFDRHFGNDADDDTLVWCADTRSMNPTVPERVIERAYAEDAGVAAAEYGCAGAVSFRRDVESFLDAEAIAAVTVLDRRELPPVPGTDYDAFVDPSGGSQDSFTLAVAHREGTTDRAVLDAVRERRPPFSPDAVVAEFAALLHTYGLTEVSGDRYAGEWPREAFRAHGITYKPSEKVKSDLYRELLPAVNAGRVELLDLPALRAQLAGLERRVARGGKDSIDHGPGAHDDVANATAGALVLALPRASGRRTAAFA